MKPAIDPVIRILAGISAPHVVADLVDQVDRAGDVGIDDPPCLAEILVQERMAETAPGICQKGVDLTALHGRIELVHAFGGRKIGLKGFDFGAAAAKRGRRLSRSRVRPPRSEGRSLPWRSASPVQIRCRWKRR